MEVLAILGMILIWGSGPRAEAPAKVEVKPQEPISNPDRPYGSVKYLEDM